MCQANFENMQHHIKAISEGFSLFGTIGNSRILHGWSLIVDLVFDVIMFFVYSEGVVVFISF